MEKPGCSADGSAYPGQPTWHSVLSRSSSDAESRKVYKNNERTAVSPTAFKRSVEIVESWLNTCNEDALPYSMPLATESPTSSLRDQIHPPSPQTVMTEATTPRQQIPRGYGIRTPFKVVSAKKKQTTREKQEGLDEPEGRKTSLKTPRKVLHVVGKVPRTPFRGKTPSKKLKTQSFVKRKCPVDVIPHGEPHNVMDIRDLLFQLTLMEEVLRTDPSSLGITSPHTARVLTKQVASKERALVGLLSSYMNRRSRLGEEIEKVKAEEAAVVNQKRKLINAEDRRSDLVGQKVTGVKVRNISHDLKSQSLKAARQVAELERLSAARSVREIFRKNQEATSGIRDRLTSHLAEVREQLAEERKKDGRVVEDLITKLNWARERYHEDLLDLLEKLDSDIEVKCEQKVDLKAEMRKLRKRITAGVDADFRWKAEQLEKGDRGGMIV